MQVQEPMGKPKDLITIIKPNIRGNESQKIWVNLSSEVSERTSV
jgi:hypothetical protein